MASELTVLRTCIIALQSFVEHHGSSTLLNAYQRLLALHFAAFTSS